MNIDILNYMQQTHETKRKLIIMCYNSSHIMCPAEKENLTI